MRNRIVEAMQHELTLLDVFKHIYLFGSVLDHSKFPNDIDILLIYDTYTDEVKQKAKDIKITMEEKFELPVDLTVLSVKEEKEVDFLNRIHGICLK